MMSPLLCCSRTFSFLSFHCPRWRTRRLHIYSLVDLPECLSLQEMSCFLGKKCNYEQGFGLCPVLKDPFLRDTRVSPRR